MFGRHRKPRYNLRIYEIIFVSTYYRIRQEIFWTNWTAIIRTIQITWGSVIAGLIILSGPTNFVFKTHDLANLKLLITMNNM